MRTLVLLLLLANLTLFGYTRLDRAASGEAARLAEQVQPDKIKLLTPQQVAALGPAKVAALADVCLEWGPFADAERARALAELEPLAARAAADAEAGRDRHRVLGLPAAGREPGRSRAARRGAQGARRRATSRRRHRRRSATPISLGVFRTEDAANARVADARAAGRRPTRRSGRASRRSCRRCSSSAIRRRRSSPACAICSPRIRAPTSRSALREASERHEARIGCRERR